MEKYHNDLQAKGSQAAKDLTTGELNFISDVLDDDSKNHHAWQYRRWIITHLTVPSEHELNFTEELIMNDLHNNSAWNHRYVVVVHDIGLTPSVFERVRLPR